MNGEGGRKTNGYRKQCANSIHKPPTCVICTYEIDVCPIYPTTTTTQFFDAIGPKEPAASPTNFSSICAR